jgi:gluconolactonase
MVGEDRGAEIEIVCEELDFPEGPVALADGSVLLVEIGGRRFRPLFPIPSR